VTVRASEPRPEVRVPFGAWYEDGELTLDFPPGWEVHDCAPAGAPPLGEEALARAFAEPIGTPPMRTLARGRRRAVIAVDDLTRPTPAHRILPALVGELGAAGLDDGAIRILIGTAAHRPPEPHEIARKLGREIAARFPVLVHDFTRADLRRLGWIAGGPVELNRHFLDADLRICVGGVIPHNETGFGGGAKLLVPGLAGHATIAHFHGALPPRTAGELESRGALDRRAWSEAVSREVGVDAVVCAVVNGRRELAGLHVGDLVEAHRAAARQALAIGRTRLPRALAESADVAIVNAYPLDTDPTQFGKALQIARKLGARRTVGINAASDGIFYHGMGMGSGLDPRRLLRNVPRLLASPRRQATWLRSLLRAGRSPLLAARLTYFTLNPLSFAAFAGGDGGLPLDGPRRRPAGADAEPLVFSPRFPEWGFRRRFRGGALFREWSELRDALAARLPHGRALVFPCAPLQLLEIE
jgi:lactate racemase